MFPQNVLPIPFLPKGNSSPEHFSANPSYHTFQSSFSPGSTDTLPLNLNGPHSCNWEQKIGSFNVAAQVICFSNQDFFHCLEFLQICQHLQGKEVLPALIPPEFFLKHRTCFHKHAINYRYFRNSASANTVQQFTSAYAHLVQIKKGLVVFISNM